MKTGRSKEAQRFFIRLRENPDHASIAKFHLGQVAYESGKYNNAIQHFRAYLRERPDDTNVLAQMAMAWFQMGDFSKAREACHKALMVDPEHLQARYALGCTLLEEGDPAEATKVFRDTLRDHPEHMPTYVEMVRTRRHTQDASGSSRHSRRRSEPLTDCRQAVGSMRARSRVSESAPSSMKSVRSDRLTSASFSAPSTAPRTRVCAFRRGSRHARW